MELPLNPVDQGMAGRWTGSKRGLELRLVLGVLERHANGISNEAQRIHFRARVFKRPHFRRVVVKITSGNLRPALERSFAGAEHANEIWTAQRSAKNDYVVAGETMSTGRIGRIANGGDPSLFAHGGTEQLRFCRPARAFPRHMKVPSGKTHFLANVLLCEIHNGQRDFGKKHAHGLKTRRGMFLAAMLRPGRFLILGEINTFDIIEIVPIALPRSEQEVRLAVLD